MAWFNRRPKAELEKRSSIDTWLQDFLIPATSGMGSFQYGGQSYAYGIPGLQTSYGPLKAQEWAPGLPGYYAALKGCPPAFAAQMVRASVLSQARFTFRRKWATAQGTKGTTFSTPALDVLHKPWANATQGELISRIEWDAGPAGNAYITNWWPGRLRVLRPDWVMIIYGSQREPDYPAHALDGKLIGYAYQNGGIGSGVDKVELISPESMAHWSPIPDPLNAGIGTGWLTPAMRAIAADSLATEHKIRYFENGMTPNLVVKGLQAGSRQEFLELVDQMEDSHAGVRNAYKTLYLTQGADATVVGSNFQQADFSAIVAQGETTIAELSRVHPTILGIQSGLEGSSLNSGNFGMARRIWADTWIYPTLQDLCAALAPLVRVPTGSDLWFDTTDMPILREDGLDAANIMQVEVTSVTQLVKEGFTAESAVASVKARDVTLLKHSGLMSVQLQPPGNEQPPADTGPGSPIALPAANGNGAAKRSAGRDFDEARAIAGAGGVYHWKHGWIPLTHAAAISKYHGNVSLADKLFPKGKRRATPQHLHEYRAAKAAQDRRFEEHVGGGISVQDTHTQEFKDYFGLGDSSTNRREERVTYRKHLQNLSAEKQDAAERQRSYESGYELGRRHAMSSASSTEQDTQYETAAAKAAHDDHFSEGYAEGIADAYSGKSKQTFAPINTHDDIAGATAGLEHVPAVHAETQRKRIAKAGQRLGARSEDWPELDDDDADELMRAIGDALTGEAKLKAYWTKGAGAAKIAWGAPHDYDRCLLHLGKYVQGRMLHGLCANMHKEALGVWPGREHGHKGH